MMVSVLLISLMMASY